MSQSDRLSRESPGPRRVLIINGHPDPSPDRFCAALCEAYAQGASKAGRQVRSTAIGQLTFPLLRTATDFASPARSPAILDAQADIRWADHVVIVHPLWLGGPPAELKAFLEQVFRYGFALPATGPRLKGLLGGRSARLIVTMGMPAVVYRLVFGAFGERALARGILWVSGFKPIRTRYYGGVGDAPPAKRASWIAETRRLGLEGL